MMIILQKQRTQKKPKDSPMVVELGAYLECTHSRTSSAVSPFAVQFSTSSYTWLFKMKLIQSCKILFLSLSSHISSVQQPCVLVAGQLDISDLEHFHGDRKFHWTTLLGPPPTRGQMPTPQNIPNHAVLVQHGCSCI
jgi:hypothetical protein